MLIAFIFSGVAIFLLIAVALRLSKKLRRSKVHYRKLYSQKKQSEVRLGQITEQLVPFLNQFPYDPTRAQFLGRPIDYIIFQEDKVIFVEVKSGNSRLSKKQKLIKSNIEEGKVEFHEIRIK